MFDNAARQREQRRSRNRKARRRRRLLERLEDRRLLSANPLSPAQRDVLVSDLDDLAVFAEHIDSFPELNRPLALIGQSFNSQLDLSTVLNERFVDPLAGFLADSPAGLTSDEVAEFLTSDQVVGSFDGLDFRVGSTTGEDGSGELVFDTVLYANRLVDYSVDLSAAEPDLGLRLLDRNESQLNFSMTLDLQFGVDTDGSFFAAIDDFNLQAIDAVEITATDPLPSPAAVNEAITFSLLINDSTSVTATLPATTSGNETPLTDRLTAALAQPLDEAGLAGGVVAVDNAGRLALRSTSPKIRRLELTGGVGLGALGFAASSSTESLFSPGMEYGFVALESISGGVAVNGQLEIFADPGTDGRLNSSELVGSPGLSLLPRGDAAVVLDVRPIAGSIFFEAPATVEISQPSFFGAAPPVVTLHSFEELDALHDEASETLTRGIEALTQFGTRLESETAYANPLPALDISLGGAIDIDTTLKTRLQQPVQDLLQASDRPSWEDVRAAWESVPGVSVTGFNETEQRVSFDVQLQAVGSTSSSIVLGDAAADVGLIVAEADLPELDLTTTSAWALQLDVDRRLTASPLEALTIQFDAADATVAASHTPSFAGRIGLLGVSSEGGMADLAATLATSVGGGQPVTAGQLVDEPIDQIVSTSASGEFLFQLPVIAALGSQSFSGSLSLPAGDVFSGESALQPVGFDVFEPFLEYAPGDLVGGIEQLSSWIGDFSSERLQTDLPFARQTRYGDAIDLRAAFEQRLVQLLKNSDGMSAFRTAQELVESVPAVSAVQYDAAAAELLFDVQFEQSMQFEQEDGTLGDQLTAALEFNVDLGELVGARSESSISLSADVASRFQLGIDLRPLGHNVAAITEATALAALNGGAGVLLEEGDDIEVQLRDGRSFDVNFGDSATVGEAIDAIHIARDAAGVSSSEFFVELREENGKAVGLRMTDQSDDRGTDFRIRAVGDSLAGVGLGTIGLDEDGDGVIDGKALHGDSFAKHLFLQPLDNAPIAIGTVDLSGSSISATANLGFVELGISDGAFVDSTGVPSHVTAAIELVDRDAGTVASRVTLSELLRAFDEEMPGRVLARAGLDGQLDLHLPVSAIVGASQFGGALDISIADFGNAFDAIVTHNIDSGLADLAELEMSDVLVGLRDGLSQLLDLGDESAFSVGLPILNVQLPDVVGLGDLLGQLTAAINSVGSTTLRTIGDTLARAAGEPISLPEFEVSFPSLTSFASAVNDLFQSTGTNETVSAERLASEFLQHFGVDVELAGFDLDAEALEDLAGLMSALVRELELAGGGSLQQLESVLESALGISADALTLAVDSSQVGAIALRIDLQLETAASAQHPFQIDLSDLGLAGVGDLLDVSGSSVLDLSAGAAAALSLGLEVSSGGVRPFLYDFNSADQTGTRIQLTASASAGDVNFDASLGPIGVAIASGSAAINRTGAAGDSQPAEFLVKFADGDSDGRIPLDGSLMLETSAAGGAFANFPIQIPSGTPAVTTLMFSVNDLTTLPDGDDFNLDEVKNAISGRIDDLTSAGIGSNLLAMVGGWEGAFDLLIETMRGEVLGVPLPLVGDALADEADFLEDIKQSVLDNISDVADQGISLVQTGIFDALGPGGLNLLQDADANGALTRDDVVAVFDTANNRVDFDIHLAKAVERLELPVDFDLGLPGLNLDVDAPVELSFGADFRLGFGAGIDEGFFFATDPARTRLELFFDADVPELSADGELAFLDIVASTIPGSPTEFDGSFVVTLTDNVIGDGNGLLTADEMFSGSFTDVVDHTLSARADVDLNLLVSLGDNSLFPRLRTDLIVDWEFTAGQGLNAPEVKFENVQMNLGDFFSGFAGELLGNVQEVLEPVQPVIDALTTPLPVISDLSGSTVTLVDLARLFGRADVANFAQAVIDINNLIVGLPEVGPQTWIDPWRVWC